MRCRLVLAFCIVAFVTAVAGPGAIQQQPAPGVGLSKTARAAGERITRAMIDRALDLPYAADITAQSEVALTEVLNQFALTLQRSVGYPIPVVSDTAELQLENIQSLDDVTIRVDAVPGGTHTGRDVLELVTRMTKEPSLTVVTLDGHLLVTTFAGAELKQETRVYDITGLIPVIPRESLRRADRNQLRAWGLLAPAAVIPANPKILRQHSDNPAGDAASGSPTPDKTLVAVGTVLVDETWFRDAMIAIQQAAAAEPADPKVDLATLPERIPDEAAFLDLIMGCTSPPLNWQTDSGEGGTLSIHGNTLIVCHQESAHRQIADLLKLLRTLIARSGTPVHDMPAFGAKLHSSFGGVAE